MQLLIDSTQETPASLRFIAATLCALADTYGPPIESLLEQRTDAQQPSINGPQIPVVLHAHTPAAPIDPAPLAAPVNDPAQMDPAAVFGKLSALPHAAGSYTPGVSTGVGYVPAGTTVDPTLPAATSTLTAPPVPAVSLGFVPPAPTMTLATALPATIAPVAPSVGAPAAVTSAVAPTAPVSAELDKDGIPWDARVHSETRKTNADGTWRYRRNLDPNVKATVTAELKALFQNTPPASPQLPLAPPPPAAEAPPAPTAPVAPQPPTAPMPVSDDVSMGVPNAPQPPNVQALGFRDFMSAVNKALAAGRMTQAQLTTACKAVNLDGITALAGEPMKIALVHSQIAHLLGAATA